MRKIFRPRITHTLKYGLIGVIFGCFFPILATFFDLVFIRDLPITWTNIILVQLELPLHWIIDTAPVFLGFIASVAGRKQEHLAKINEGLESIVTERTRSLEDKNKLLSKEISERIVIEKQLIIAKEEAIRAKNAEEAFLANMSHEIRTPMNGIVGFTDLLIHSDLSSEQSEFVASIKHSTSHLMAIINDILDVSKIKAGRIEFEQIDIDLRDLLRNLVNTLRVSASVKNIQLLVEVDPEVPETIMGDPVRLSQILLNLANNAIKFTHQGHVKIAVKYLESSNHQVGLRFAIEDTGIGILPNQIENIFKDFLQAEAKTTRIYGGTGLGLSISKKLVELQGGKIEVVSEIDKGSVFSFSIIFKKAIPSILVKNEDQEVDDFLPEGCKVLIVDDNRINRVLASKLIAKGAKNIFIEFAENGQEAVDLFNKQDFDFILLDLQMPIMDGFETCKFIRNKFPEPKNKVPIIALTAEALPHEKIKAFEAGMNEYVIKPFKKRELFGKINFLLGKNFIGSPAAQVDLKSEVLAEEAIRNTKYN
ncbi:MAG: response regulator [Saprospiraceae bacterium]|nr:response regulator [Saprospiraceae bacterium]